MTLEELALQYVRDNTAIGLGTGRAATRFVRALGARVRAGLRVRGVPTSEATADLARELGIPLATLDDVESLDVTIDGADEVDPQLDLIKGYGGALVREKIVASAARQLVILVGTEKLVPALGSRGILPVEVIPMAVAPVARAIGQLGYEAAPRLAGDRPYASDNGNYILHCKVRAIPDPAQLEERLRAIPGVVGTGLFVGMAAAVIVDEGGRATARSRQPVKL